MSDARRAETDSRVRGLASLTSQRRQTGRVRAWWGDVWSGLETAAQGAAVCEALTALVTPVAEALERAPDPAAVVSGTPDWPLAELAAHVASVPGLHVDKSDLGPQRWARSYADMPRSSEEARSHLVSASLAELGAIAVAELLLHGLDIARTLDGPWKPTPRPRLAVTSSPGREPSSPPRSHLRGRTPRAISPICSMRSSIEWAAGQRACTPHICAGST